MNPRGPGRPRTLSQALIVTEARRIADEEGLAALTVRHVAQRLGTGQASLYRHIADRGQLLSLLAADVAAQLPPPTEHPDVRERIHRQWLAAHDHLARHGWAARIIAEGEHASPGADAFTEGALGALARAGLQPADAPRAYRVLWDLLLGHLLNNHPVGHAVVPRQQADRRADFAWALARLLDGMLGVSPSPWHATPSCPPSRSG